MRALPHLPRHLSCLTVLLFAWCHGTGTAEAQVLLWRQVADNYASLSSQLSTDPALDREFADDFDLEGTVERVIAYGRTCAGCSAADVQAVWVRFYAWDNGEVGLLQHELRVPHDDAMFLFDPLQPGTLDVTLPVPFEATGKHWLSIQLESGVHPTWYWESAGDGQHSCSTLRVRDGLGSGAFEPYVPITGELDRDIAFDLWGQGDPFSPQLPGLVWSQLGNLTNPTVTSSAVSSAGLAVEATDDFEFDGDLTSFLVQGSVCFPCPYPTVLGARVRFYEWTPGGPGTLLDDRTLTGANFSFQGLIATGNLDPPFEASGRYYFSFQLQSANVHGWGWREDQPDASALEPAYLRDEAVGAPWSPYSGGSGATDLGFQLFGIATPAPPPAPTGDPCGSWFPLSVPFEPDVSHSVLRDVKVFAPDDVRAVGTRTRYLQPLSSTSGTVAYRFNGSVWTEVAAPNPEPYPGAGGAGLYAIDGVAPDDVWAAGTQRKQGSGGFVGNQTLVLHDDGTGWVEVPSPLTPGVPGTLQGTSGGVVRDIEAIASDDVWFVGNWTLPFACNYPLAMRWDGSEFSVFDLPCDGLPGSSDGFDLRAVSAVDSNDVWAVGGGKFAFAINSYVVHFDGSSWTSVQVPQVGIVQQLFDVEAIASDDVWAVGQYQDDFGIKAFSIHWDGSSWAVHPLLTGSLGLHAEGPDAVYAVGGGISRWNGMEWEFVDDLQQSSGQASGVSLAAVDAADACELHAVGRHLDAGAIKPFSARILFPTYWSQGARSGCTGFTLPDALELQHPAVPGEVARALFDDPFGASGATPGSSVPVWVLSLEAGSNYPCGQVQPGFGGAEHSSGEVMLDLGAQSWLVVPPAAWNGPGQAVELAIGVPDNAALIGIELFTQAALFDLTTAAPPSLSNALDLRIGE